MRLTARLRRFTVFCLVLLLLGTGIRPGAVVSAQESSRVTRLIVPYTEYIWWLISWDTNEVVCQITTDHEGLPSLEDVAASCGNELAKLWWQTPPCQLTGKKVATTDCVGYYVYLITSQPKEREVIVELPKMRVSVDLAGCTPVPPENRCPQLPALLLIGEEPLPNERIVSIQGLYDGQPFTCQSDACLLPLRPTPLEGIRIEFSASSTFGDTSEAFSAQVRVLDTGVGNAPGESGWYVDVISSEWRGPPLASCARLWESFPPAGGPPSWLSTPEHPAFIATEEPYYYLAGRLIAQGLVDVSACPGGGLLPNGYADTCGLEKARDLVEIWQNQFDEQLITAARETGVPAQLMKSLFAQESQFWPGIFRIPYEFGLGQLTENGADALLLWNPEFYQQFCPLVLSEEACSQGYLNLPPKQQAIVRGALALQAKADCRDCPTGVDLSSANFSIPLFANTLVANCAQISRTIYNATNNMAGRVASYEDLWRLTVANYHAGPGCVSYAIHSAWLNSGSLAWDEVAKYFTPPCQGVIPYVEKITR